MTLSAINFLSFDAVGEAFGAWCRRFSVKELMAAFPVAEQTAKKWRTGKLPEPKHMVMMTERWGEAFLLTIFAPAMRCLDVDDLTRDLEVIETKVSLIRERIAHEKKRSDRLGLVSRHGIDGNGAAGAVGAVAGELGQRQGGGVKVKGRATGRRHPVLGAIAGALMLSAASLPLVEDIAFAVATMLGATVSPSVDDDDDALRVPRRVRVVRVRHGAKGRGFA